MIIKEKKHPLVSGYTIQTITGKDKKGVYFYIGVINEQDDSVVTKFTYRNSTLANIKFRECKEIFSKEEISKKTLENTSPADYNLLKRESKTRSEERGAADDADEVRTDAETIPERIQTGNLCGSDPEKCTGRTFTGNTGKSDDADRVSDQTAGKGGRDNRSPESRESTAVGAEDEQYPTLSGGDCPAGIDLHDKLKTQKVKGDSVVIETLPPFLCAEKINALLCDDTYLKVKINDIIRYFKAHKGCSERATFLKSIYNEEWTELFVLDHQRVGYKKEDYGLLMWEGSFMSHTAESRFSWDMLQAYISSLIEQKIYKSSTEKRKHEKKQSVDQISLFDFGSMDTLQVPTSIMPAPEEEVQSSLLSQEQIEEILRTGGSNRNSRVRIYAKYERGKTPEEMQEFLKKEYGTTAKGFTFDSQNYAVWFDETGAKIGKGTSAFRKLVTTLSWTEIEEVTRKMVTNGTYMAADEVATIDEIERQRVADRVFVFFRDMICEIPEDLSYLRSCGWPDGITYLSEKMCTKEGLLSLHNLISTDIQYLKTGEKKLRWRFVYTADDVLDEVSDMLLEKQSFPVHDTVPVKQVDFITQDEIDYILMSGSSYSSGKKRIYEYFMKGHSPKENIEFLKKEFGWSGSSHALLNCDGSWKQFDGKGLEITKDNLISSKAIKVTLGYTAIEKRIRELIKNGSYTIETPDVTKATAAKNNQKNEELSSDPSAVSAETIPSDTEVLTAMSDTSPAEQPDINLDGQGIQGTTGDSVQNVLSELLPDAALEVISENETSTAVYEVGDTVYLDDTAFVITNIGLFDIRLSDSTMSYPIDRSESKDQFLSLLKRDKRNAHFFQEKKQEPLKTADLVNFHWTGDFENLEKSFSPKEKFRQNTEAIRTLQLIESENRYATPEEQEILAKYVGWGGLADAFDPNKSSWTNEYHELKNLLSAEEYSSARESVLTAYFTSPVIIKYIYEALNNFGFKKGNILDPALGVGNFFSMLPETMQNSKLYGVELDSITGRIAKQLYPLADIKIRGFEETDYPNDFFDVAIGNVPFGDYKVSDRVYDKHNFLIHDYFFAKTIDKVRPGGIIAFVTSKGTMDKQNTAVRKYIAARAELLGAIRLPNTAFKANANTEVTSDILFLKKRDRQIIEEPDWVQLEKTADGIEINRYFAAFPEMILGNMEMVSGPYGMQATCSPNQDYSLSDLLARAICRIKGQLDESVSEQANECIPADPNVKNYSFTIVDDKLYYRENSVMTPVKVPKITEQRIKGMMQLRDCTYQLIDFQLDDYTDAAIAEKQAELNKLYDAFTKKYGLLTSQGNKRAFIQDSGYFMLSSLEILDDDGNLVGKADMFHKRTINKPKVFTNADTSADALNISLNEKAKIDLPFMAQLTGKDEQTIIKDLSGVIFMNPITESWEPADEYLSGNVAEKLTIAKSYAASDSRYEVNVKSLEQVQPKKLDASEIEIRLGATWVNPKYIEDFIHDTFKTSPLVLGNSIKVMYSEVTGTWRITKKSADTSNPIPNKTYGTSRLNGYELLESCLNLRDAKVFDYIEQPNGKLKAVLNKAETLLAVTKQETIKEAFKEWVFQDQERRQALCDKYNALFNTRRPRVFDGSHLQFHGMSPDIELKPHQKNAVARILYGKNTLLAHCVGAGKTFEMAAAAMELKYIGLCNKAMFVVPNHLTEQWTSEFLRLYPGAKILATRQSDFEKNNRKKFCSKIATGDYDAIIIGHSQFEKIPISAERQISIIERQIDELELAILDAERSNREHFTIKQMESTKKKLKERLTSLNENSKKDNVITFEQLGVDQLFVDESHNYKNLFLYTKMNNVAGVAHTEAKKSSDMFAKCQYMDELTGGRGITFATGTPLSNSMTELYTNMRYLQYNTLVQLGLGHFDSWASSFGETRTVVELTPEGTGYQAKTRFSRFYNLPELIALFKECADIQTAEMLNLPRPEAEYVDILLKPSELQRELVAELGERAEKIRNGSVNSSEDNMLLITNDGRKLALDQRLFCEGIPENEDSKVNACVKNALQLWRETRHQKGAQLIFCDISTPKKNDSFNVYDDIRNKLIVAGVPAEEIAFIHDANTDIKKAKLFAKVRKGRVRFLLGSTSKMGAGTNVQDRLISLHHLDVPWRPSDIEQREGRILRQGNMNTKIKIFRYITENTFDSYSWQIIENKQRFISQIMTDKSPVRSAEDIDETTLNYAEVKALAAGNPMIKEKMDLDVQVARLKLYKANFASQKYRLEDDISINFPMKISHLQEMIAGYKSDIQRYEANKPTTSEAFNIKLVNSEFDNRNDAGTVIIEYCRKMLKDPRNMAEIRTVPVTIGEYLGFKLQIYRDGMSFFMLLKGELSHTTEVKAAAVGNMIRLEHSLADMYEDLPQAEKSLAYIQEQLENAKIEVTKPFPKEEELKEKQARLIELNALLNITDADKAPAMVG